MVELEILCFVIRVYVVSPEFRKVSQNGEYEIISSPTIFMIVSIFLLDYSRYIDYTSCN